MDVATEQEARLIVVGPRDLSGGLLQSSVSDDVAHRAPCNVLLFRAGELTGGDEGVGSDAGDAPTSPWPPGQPGSTSSGGCADSRLR
jgi:hypothetical protein